MKTFDCKIALKYMLLNYKVTNTNSEDVYYIKDGCVMSVQYEEDRLYRKMRDFNEKTTWKDGWYVIPEDKNGIKILFKMKSGSHLYGLNTEKSDEDYVGVYVESDYEDFLDPFNTKDEYDESVKSKLENGKNNPDAIDCKYFHLKKFIKLCAGNNPSVFEMLFAPEECIEYIHPHFKILLNRRGMFLSKRLIDKFIGYAKSQEQKSYTKSEKYLILNKFVEGLRRMHQDSILREVVSKADFSKHFKDKYNIITSGNDEVLEIGQMKFPFGITVKETVERIDDRFKRASHRVDDIVINKYEPKSLSHTLRLLYEGMELIETGNISLPFTGIKKENIMGIKTGETSLVEAVEVIQDAKDMFAAFEKSHELPDNPQYEYIKLNYCELIKRLYHA